MRKCILLMLFVLSASCLLAQVSGGVRLGANLANQKVKSGPDTQTGDVKSGVLVGFYLTANATKVFAFQPELLFSAMGSKDKSTEIRLRFNYVSVPLLLRFNITEYINLHLGPQVSFLASAKVASTNNSSSIKDGFKGSDTGGVIGLGINPEKLSVGIRYYAGFANILDQPQGDETFKNNAVQFYLGLRLFGR